VRCERLFARRSASHAKKTPKTIVPSRRLMKGQTRRQALAVQLIHFAVLVHWRRFPWSAVILLNARMTDFLASQTSWVHRPQ
jgi:hypothetical protein